ncbi:tRNA(Ile)-lysidine synthase [Maribacter vaceletii]|uniref:tRNA(Ile)-lysidine synthase n=1 Tax=Maribacter vaceletii TaxID=1206816 RepID=A0A495EBG3_9FLAO|nr:tRNA lysidine(34) synthetase TilS [Maribacter vaceletii]RKR13237.1 tRNA(Ile)-lysidine synthase [Maribacter vaceletii]
MQEYFNTHIEKSFPELKPSKFLLACSGGIDSVVLAHLCNNANLDFELAHCNFQLRGKESDADEVFVKELAKKINKKINVTSFKTVDYVNLNKVSVQVAARELRYTWFSTLQEKNNLKYLVTAHHADDDLETFIINLSRGTGIDGLKGMPYNTDVIKRPLLKFSQEQIIDFAHVNTIEWREDQSNTDTKYLRNKIRHQIVPLLKELHPSFLDNFLNSQQYLEQTATIADNALNTIKKDLFQLNGSHYKIAIESLKALNPLKGYIHGLFKFYGFTEWQNVADLLDAMSGKEIRSKTYRLVKDRDYLLLEILKENKDEVFTVLKEDIFVDNPIPITITNVEEVAECSLNTLYIDKETLKYPLTIRKWKNGDYFYPFGMHGKKKLAKFFKDEKIDVLSKEKQWLLCSENQIVWVIGKRADNRFRVTNKTKHILKFEVKE